MKIKIVCVGKLKEKYLKDGIAEYVKRIGRFADVDIVELSDIKIPDNPSEAECEKIKDDEGLRILSKIKKEEFVYALCVEGKQMQSEVFAQSISSSMLRGYNTITFIIGGSLGLSDNVKKTADVRLSFSEMTFPHQLMRLILTEQIYRAFKINSNEQYHK